MQLKNNENENFDELLNIKFPINNKTFNYMIIDANLAIKENLQNIFLIEFDLLNNNKDNNYNNKFMKLLREINHPDREIFFVLNGTIHGIKMFTSELKFSVEQRKFIKSIQFKLDTYKKDLINQKIQHPNSPDKLKIRNTFFAKVLSNTNIGIEFSKPHFDMRNPEKFQTNFNSIVNSKININKIFLEVSIPKSFLSSNDYLTRIDDKIEENENQIKEILLDKFNDNSNEKTTSTTFASNNNNSNINTNSNINNTGYNSPTLSGFENLFNNNIYSKSSLRNKQLNIPSLNQNFNFNFMNIKEHSYNSPHLGYSYPKFLQQQNMMTPDNFSLLFGGGRSINNNNTVNNINNSTFSSSIHFSPNFGINNFNFNSYLPVSPGGRSYIGNNNQIMFNNFNNNTNNKIYPNIPPFELDPNNSMLSRYSENSLFSESNNNYNLNSPKSVVNYSSNYYNTGFNNINNNFNVMNNQSRLSVRSFGRTSNYEGNQNNNIFNNLNNMSFNLNANHGYMSPRNVSNLNFANFNISEDKNVFKGIPTIKKKIMDWEKLNSEKDIKKDLNKETNNYFNNNSDIINSIKIENSKKIDNFIEYYEGTCNYLIFLRNSTPYLNKKYLNNYRDITLDNFLKAFQKISLLGLKIDFLSNCLNDKNNINNKNLWNICYSVTLSSLEITFNNKDIIISIIDYLISIKKCSAQIKAKIEENYSKDQIINMNNLNNLINKNSNYMEFYPIDKNNSLKVVLRGFSKISIEYNENKPPHLRKNFYKQIKDILNILNLNNITINNIVGKSYFSIRYTPINCRNKNNIQTSFINYYRFKINEERITYTNKYIDMPIIGVLPLKFYHKFFLETINKNYINNSNNISDVMIVNRLIQKVTNNIIQNGNDNSIDVEYYLNQQINI